MVVKKLKTNKAPGPDGIKNELIKSLPEGIVSTLTKIFNKILGGDKIPDSWVLSKIILLFKKGNQTGINNYRPISLSPNICKIFMMLLKNKIYRPLDFNQPVEQAGFRRDYSTVDHIHQINQIIRKN